MPISKEIEDARMWALADKLADSGEFSSWHLIEAELRQDFPRARRLLDNETDRARLDARCRAARSLKTAP